MVDRRGEEIRVQMQAHEVSAYVATAMSGRGAGVIVVHDAWGLNDFARDVCDRLARAEFVALAPDLMGGRRATRPEEAEQLAKGLDPERAGETLDRAVIELLSHDATIGRTLGVLGFGIGGSLALALAGRGARVGAVVGVYPDIFSIAVDFAEIQVPVLAIFAGADPSIDAAQINDLEARMRAAKIRCSVQTRAGVVAGFMNDSRPDVHDAVAEFESWDTLLGFFRAELS